MNSDEHSAAEWEKVFSDLISFGISEFDITGGEPLLRKDLLPVYKSLKSGGAKVSLLTNGTLINCIDDAALIKESFTDVYLSIDSHIASVNDRYRGNGSYALATNAAKLLSLCGIEWTAKAVFQPDNVGPLYDVRDYVLGLGAKKFDVSLLSGQCADDLSMAAVVYALYCERMSNASLEKLSADFNDRKFGNPCAAARSEIAIDASGEVYPCRSLLSSEMRCGNLYDSTISFIWNNSSVLAQIRNIDFNNINGCKKCSLLRLCLGGCRAIAYQNCNSLNGYIGHYYCALYKRRILNNIRKMVNRQIL
jgi:radical SAM protein with 4Fe4S-binding SPASM domain